MDRMIRARAVLAELDALGLTMEDLSAAGGTSGRVGVPTVAEYVELVAAAYKPGTANTYRSAWRVLVDLHGARPVSSLTSDDCHQVIEAAVRRAQERRPGATGRSTTETCVAALRAVFRRAVQAGLCAENPAAGIDKPRRLDNRRRALTTDELDQVWMAALATSRDPDLDLLALRFHLETGARREGALNLTLDRLDPRRQSLWLLEKFGAEREQPVSASLLRALAEHAGSRGAHNADDAVFRTRRHHPMTRRRYNTLFEHIQASLEWTARTPVTAHVLRHTAITRVERHAGYAVAARFAGHSQRSNVTGTYIKASVHEVAAAVAALTGEPHPLAHTVRPPTEPDAEHHGA